jgi:hypothetical protein
MDFITTGTNRPAQFTGYGLLMGNTTPADSATRGFPALPLTASVPTGTPQSMYDYHGGATGVWSPLTNGSTGSPELIFAGGDVIMVGG